MQKPPVRFKDLNEEEKREYFRKQLAERRAQRSNQKLKIEPEHMQEQQTDCRGKETRKKTAVGSCTASTKIWQK